jgi:hypothetical protein
MYERLNTDLLSSSDGISMSKVMNAHHDEG